MLATGCISVTFPEPMPYNRKDLTSFPNAWHGIWSSHATGTDDTGEDELLVIFPDRLQGHEGDDLILGKTVFSESGAVDMCSASTWTTATGR